MAKRSSKIDLRKFCEEVKDKDPELLGELYNEYSSRMKHDGTMIWQIGSIFIPLSLSGIVLGLDDYFRTFAVGIFSILLIWTWYFISDAIGYSLMRNLSVCGAIEAFLLKLEEPESNSIYKLIPRDKKIPHLSDIRLMITILITLGWVGVAFLSYFVATNP